MARDPLDSVTADQREVEEAVTLSRPDGAVVLEDGPSSDDLLPRGSMLGRYVVIDHLGAGGMGVVYAAYDPDLDRRVAVKVLKTSETAREATDARRARLLREAQAIARLSHPNVISVYDVGTYEGSVFFAMEYVAGVTLRERFAKAWKAGEPDWQQTLELFVAAGRGLAAAHRAGVVHRDFKPDNVMIDVDGRVVVLDFGLARPSPDGPSSVPSGDSDAAPRLASSLTKTGTMMGTPAYMAAEQLSGRKAGAPADQFAFCVALYEALYGERPFPGDTFVELGTNVVQMNLRPAPKGSRVPLWLRRALVQGLQRKAEARHPSMDALLGAIQRDPGRRWRILALSGGGIGLLALAAATGAEVARNEPCLDTATAMDDVWTPTRADGIRTAFDDVGKAYAREAYEKLVPLVDDYAEGWRTQRREACEASRVRGEQSDEVMGLRMACLDSRLHRLDVFLEGLEHGGPSKTTTALASAHALPSLERCADVEALRSDVPPPEDPEVREEVEAIRRQTLRAAELADAMTIEEARDSIDEAVVRARVLDYPPILAEALQTRAELELNLGDTEAATEAAWRALVIAEANRFDALTVRSLELIARCESTFLLQHDSARRRLEHAEAILSRMHPDPAATVRLLARRGDVEGATGEIEAAIGYYERAHRILVDTGKDQDVNVLNLLNSMSAAYVADGRLDDAQRVSEQAAKIGRERLGPQHPAVADAEVALGRIAAHRGDPARAAEHFEAARATFVGSLGTEHVNVGAADNQLGSAYRALGRLEESRAAFESALVNMSRQYGSKHVVVGKVHRGLGDLLHELGELELAIEHHASALEIVQGEHGPDDSRVPWAMLDLAEDHRLAGNDDEALELYEEIGEAPGTTDDLAAHASFGQARVYWARGEEQRALQLARKAERGWSTRASNNRVPLTEVREWLEARPEPL